jgi:MinD-like ATPase involved in chromosome partitioning or flagellar assembly
VLIDSPAGSPPIAFWILDVSDYSNLVLIDEPTSISDVYRLCKYVFNVTDDYKFNAIINQSENEEDGLETYSKFKHLIKNFLKKDIPYFGQVVKKNIITKLMKSNQCIRITNVDDDIRMQFDILSNQIIKLNKD